MFKPPLTVLVHALALTLFGHTMTAIRALDALWTLATGLALYALVRRGFGASGGTMGTRAAAVAAGVGFAVAYHQLDYWNTAQTDGWASLPTGLGFVLVLAGEGRRAVPTLLAGLCLGVAFVFKYPLGIMLPVALAALAALRGWACVRPAALLVAGFVAAVGLVGLWLLAEGGLAEFVATQRGVLAPYVEDADQKPWSSAGRFLWLYPDAMVWCAIAGTVLALGALLRRVLRPVADGRPEVAGLLLLLGWLVGALISLFSQGRFLPYHYLPLAPPIALLSVYAAARALDLLPARLRAGVAWVAVGVAFVVALQDEPYPTRLRAVAQGLDGSEPYAKHWTSDRYKNRDMSLADNVAMADWLRENTRPEDPVFLWTYDPMIYFLANRRLVSRFLYTYPIVVRWGADAYDRELLAALRAEPPAVFVVGSGDATPPVMGHADDSAATFAKSGPIRDFVERNYRRVEPVRRFAIYVRKSPGVTP